jgi:alpha-L-fucosidase 2
MKRIKLFAYVTFVAVLLSAFCFAGDLAIELDKPAVTSDDGIPLANGLLGVMVWGDGGLLRFSLDRTDLWDLRKVTAFDGPDYKWEVMKKCVRAGDLETLRDKYERPYRKGANPTKIPAGRIEITTGKKVERMSLDIFSAVGRVELAGGGSVRSFVHADRCFGLIEFSDSNGIEVKLIAPDYAGSRIADASKHNEPELKELGYPAAIMHQGKNWQGFTQQGWDGFEYAVVVMEKNENSKLLISWSVACNSDSKHPLVTAGTNCTNAMNTGFDYALSEHKQWWTDFWKRSSVKLPNPVLNKLWHVETYKIGATMRPDTPPVTLQGPWTTDNGRMPPWKGDYHNDLNTELSYWPCYSSNHLDAADGFVNWLWKIKPNAQKWTKQFYGDQTKGFNIPGVVDLEGKQMGGWHMYSFSPATVGWLSHHFYLHWRYSMDRDFLENKAYPFVSGAAQYFESVSFINDKGKRTFEFSSSPEINKNHLDAWFVNNITNYDLSIMRFTFKTAGELAGELGLTQQSQHWKKMLSQLPSLAVDDEKGLLMAANYPLPRSHRHFSHLMSIYPFELITPNDPAERKIIDATLENMRNMGTEFWTGYSFAWYAAMSAIAHDGNEAERALEIFSSAFCLKNTFHCNGDQSGKGHSKFTYKPFTLEGNFAAAQAIQLMLLQSGAGFIEVFPAVPDSWGDVSFENLLAEGAFEISAKRSGKKCQKVRIFSKKGEKCVLLNPFLDDKFSVKGVDKNSLKQQDRFIIIPTKAGQEIILKIAN